MRFFKGRAMAYQMEAEAGPLALSAYPRGRQPDRRHQVAARQLGQHVGVDAVGLGRQRGDALDLAGVGQGHLPALPLERIVDEARAVHRLDGGVDRLAVSGQPCGKAAQTVDVWWGGRRRDPPSVLIEQADVHALP